MTTDDNDYHYEVSTAGTYVLYKGQKALWEDFDARKLVDYCREKYGVRPKLRRCSILIVR